MKLTILGTGTSQGVPMLVHSNTGLDLSNSKNWRTRSSVHIQMGDIGVQVDCSPEFRLQCLKNNIEKISLVIITHGHTDHIMGMDDLRRFCDLSGGKALDVYSEDYGLERVKEIYPYAICDKAKFAGYPAFSLNKMPKVLELENGAKITSFLLNHGFINSLGLVFEYNNKKIAYYCDCSSLTNEAIEKAKGADILVIESLRIKPHLSHLNLAKSLAYAKQIGAKKTYFTHMTYQMDYDIMSRLLPENVHLAYDGLLAQL